MSIISTDFIRLANIFVDQEQQFYLKIDGERKSFCEPRRELLRIKQNYTSIEKLKANLHDGTFTTTLDGIHLEGFFRQRKGKNLYVGFTGARKVGNYKQKFPRWSYSEIFHGSFLGIDDPMAYIHNDLPISWYYGTKECSYINICVKLVKIICDKLQIPYNDVIFIGSSGGGYTALYAATLLEKSLSISLNPQLTISKYYNSPIKIFQKKTGIFLEDPDPFNRNNLIKQVKEHSSSHHVIICNAQDTLHFEQHFLPFAQSFGANIRYGLTPCQNILFWTYDSWAHPHPHNAMETKVIFSIFDYIAKEFKAQCISEKHQEFIILINELWRDIYEGKKEVYEELEKKSETPLT